MMVVLYFSCDFDVVVQRGEPSLSMPPSCVSVILFLKDFIHLFLEGGEGTEKEGEKHQCVVASHAPPSGNLVCNPGMCPEWESSW